MAEQKEVIKYVVFEDNSHEYHLVVTKSTKKTKFELFHSDNPLWTEKARNKLAFKLVIQGIILSYLRKCLS